MGAPATTTLTVTPPDGGWGWMVVFGSFMIHLLADGMAYSYGVYVKYLVIEFEASYSEVGFLGSLLLGVTWGCGPLASALVNKFGCKAVAIGGTVLAAFGFFISIFSPNIYFMYVSFGIIAGAGLGMAYLPSIVAVSFYFEKRRSFATGLAVCGSGIGTFVFAPLTQLLVDEYGWKGSLLIETAILLNCIACGAVFRPMEDLERTQKKKELKNAEKHKSSVPGIVVTDSATSIEMKKMAMSEQKTNTNTKAASTQGINKVALSLQDISPDPRSRSTQDVNVQAESADYNEKSEMKNSSSKNLTDRKDKFYPANLTNIPLYKSNSELYKATISVTSLDKGDDEVDHATSAKKLLDCSIMRDVCFLLFIISNFLTSVGLCVPYVFLPDRAMEQLHLPEEEAYKTAWLISFLGAANTIGRVVFGFLADFKWVNRLMLYNTVLVLCGVGSLLSAFCLTYFLLAMYSSAFGLLIGVYICLTPVVLVDLLGLERLSNAFGLVLLFQGIGGVVGPPMAGAIFDVTKDYNNSFYFMGICIFISGVMLFPIPAIQRCLNKKLTPEEVALGKKSAVQDINGSPALPEETHRLTA